MLVFGDLIAFAVMREFLRAVRDFGVFGQTIMSLSERLTPRGVLAGWEYALALLVGLFATGNYGRGDMRRDPGRILAACAVATAFPFWMVMWTHGPGSVLAQYLLTTGLVWVGLAIERQILDRVIIWIAPPERHASRTLFVGTAADCREAMDMPAFKAAADFRIVGYVEASIAPTPGALGALPNLARCLHEVGAETVVVCGYLSDVRFQDVVDTALSSGCQLLSVPRSTLLAGVRPNLLFRSGQPLIELTAPSLKAWQFVVKRLVDTVGALVMLVLGAPVLLAAALAIKLDSPGPVLFLQERIGFCGVAFRMMKFRTMRTGADAEKAGLAHLNQTGDPRLFKIQDDPRITRVGRWLRKWSVDELPQLFNVLRGEMSLVGPRPFFEADLATYEDHHFRRLGAKPGITGLWQVNGRSTILDFEEVVRLDREYIEKWSLWLDLSILLRTVPAVMARSGAF